MVATKCKSKHLSKKRVHCLQHILLSSDMLQNLAETFKVLGDPTRLNIIHVLSKQELCVCRVAADHNVGRVTPVENSEKFETRKSAA